MGRNHIVRSFDDELEELRLKVLALGDRAEAQLEVAVAAVVRGAGGAETIESSEDLVDKLEHEVDRLTVRMLALRQPVGMDLWGVVSALKIATDLERIADYAVDIATGVEKPDPVALSDPMDAIARMGNLAKNMLKDILYAYRLLDTDMAVDVAVDVWSRKKRVDEIYARLLVQLRASMKENAGNIDPCTSLMFAGRCLDRIGDHIKNIAEHVAFGVTGEDFPYHRSHSHN